MHPLGTCEKRLTEHRKMAKSVELKGNGTKTKIIGINSYTQNDIRLDGQRVDNVTVFKYLGSFITTDSNIEKEVQTRITLASAAFQRMGPIWKSM